MVREDIIINYDSNAVSSDRPSASIVLTFLTTLLLGKMITIVEPLLNGHPLGSNLWPLNQWRSQPENLVPLCKFEIIIIIHFFRN